MYRLLQREPFIPAEPMAPTTAESDTETDSESDHKRYVFNLEQTLDANNVAFFKIALYFIRKLNTSLVEFATNKRLNDDIKMLANTHLVMPLLCRLNVNDSSKKMIIFCSERLYEKTRKDVEKKLRDEYNLDENDTRLDCSYGNTAYENDGETVSEFLYHSPTQIEYKSANPNHVGIYHIRNIFGFS